MLYLTSRNYSDGVCKGTKCTSIILCSFYEEMNVCHILPFCSPYQAFGGNHLIFVELLMNITSVEGGSLPSNFLISLFSNINRINC